MIFLIIFVSVYITAQKRHVKKNPIDKIFPLTGFFSVFVAVGFDRDLKEGIERARDAIDSGRAKEKLDALVSFTQQCTYILCVKNYRGLAPSKISLNPISRIEM